LPAGHPPADEVGANGGEGQRGHRHTIPHPGVAEERRKAVGSGLAKCAGGSSASAPAAASSGSGAGEARSPGGAAWCKKRDGVVSSVEGGRR
jgi:hypothetical protein